MFEETEAALAPDCRVHTMSLPVLGELHQMYGAADEGAIATLLAKLAVEKSYQAKLEETRQVRRHMLCIIHTRCGSYVGIT